MGWLREIAAHCGSTSLCRSHVRLSYSTVVTMACLTRLHTLCTVLLGCMYMCICVCVCGYVCVYVGMCVLHPDDMRCGSSVYVCTVHRGSVCYLIRCDVITMGYVCASLISQHHLVPSLSTSHLPHPLTPSLPPP